MAFGKPESPGAGDKTQVRAQLDDSRSELTCHGPAQGVPRSALASAEPGPDWDNPQDWARTRSAPVQVGSTIKDRYVLQALLGKGAMGVVYGARDLLYEEFGDRE